MKLPILASFGAVVLATSIAAQETTRVSVDSAGAQANGTSSPWSISANGRFIAFVSFATNLVAGDGNGRSDVFVHDGGTGQTECISVDSTGAVGNGVSAAPSLSADGEFVAFSSYASNLVSGDTNHARDVFVRDRTTGVTERVSVDSSGAEGNFDSGMPTISADGRWVVFLSYATNLVYGDTNGIGDVFVHDRTTGETERVSVDSFGGQGDDSSGDWGFSSISANGVLVGFLSVASNLVDGDRNKCVDAFVHDRSTGITERVSIDSSGYEANGVSLSALLSGDGSLVVIESFASNLVPGDTNAAVDIFLRDRNAGTTTRVSVTASGGEANGGSVFASFTPDGRYVAFDSAATNLVSGDTNGVDDIFVHDLATGANSRVNVDSSGGEANGDSGSALISADGLAVAFQSLATNLVDGDTNGVADAFVHDPCPGYARWSNYGAGFPGTFGVPSFTARQNPLLGTTVTLDLANSYAHPTAGLLFIGFQRTSLHSGWGGDLLVVPSLTLPFTFSYGFDSFSGDVPDDFSLCGFTIDLQAFEADPGAAKGVSFTAGLELVLGH